MKENIKPATGRLGVLVVGVGGAVATTMITGTFSISFRFNRTNGYYAHAGWQRTSY